MRDLLGLGNGPDIRKPYRSHSGRDESADRAEYAETPARRDRRRALHHRFCDQKIGWGRIGVAISLTIIAIAVFVLFKTLHGIELKDVLQALRRSDPRDILLAALFVAFGYFTLTFYDLFALRTIGRA